MNDRLQQFLAAENITQADLAETIKVTPASVSHILNGRNKPGYDFIAGMLRHYPNLNIEWLISGKGKMYKTDRQQEPATAGHSLFDAVQEDVPIRENDGAAEKEPKIRADELSALHEALVKASAIQSAQEPPKQRKAVKIVIFYDDDTFQELFP